MPSTVAPKNPKIAHIVHMDRLSSIVKEGCLWCDAEVVERSLSGTTIGIGEIKIRRMSHTLMSHPTLKVGQRVPFYFWPRSVMADDAGLRSAFTLSSAGAAFFEDRATLDDLGDIDWKAVKARDWRDPLVKERKQAEFLVEGRFAWQLVSRIGVFNSTRRQVTDALAGSKHQPVVEVRPEWYY